MDNLTLVQLKRLRQLKGWSQSTLAQMAGVSLRTIQRAEKGQATSHETAKAIASVFELSSYHDLAEAENDALKNDNRTSFSIDTKKESTPPPYTYTGKTPLLQGSEEAVLFMLFVSVMCTLMMYRGYFESLFSNITLLNSDFAMACIVTTFSWTIFNLLAIRRKEKCDKFTLPKNISFAPRRVGIEGYTSRYSIEENAMIIGEIKKQGQRFPSTLLRHKRIPHNNSMISFGEHGSGHYIMMMSQCFPMLRNQRGGLIIIDNKSASIVYHLVGMLEYIGRKEDLLVHGSKDIQNWNKDDWLIFQNSNLIVVVISDPSDKTFSCDQMALNIIDACAPQDPLSIQPTEESERKFLWVNDKNIENYNPLLKSMQDAQLFSRLNLILSVTDADHFVARNDAKLITKHFAHRYVQKIHNPETIEKIHDILSVSLFSIPWNTLKILSYGPGKGCYFYQDRAWDDVFFTYIDTPIPKEAFSITPYKNTRSDDETCNNRPNSKR